MTSKLVTKVLVGLKRGTRRNKTRKLPLFTHRRRRQTVVSQRDCPIGRKSLKSETVSGWKKRWRFTRCNFPQRGQRTASRLQNRTTYFQGNRPGLAWPFRETQLPSAFFHGISTNARARRHRARSLPLLRGWGGEEGRTIALH